METIPNACMVCGEALEAGDQIEFQLFEPMPVGRIPLRCLYPVHTVCGQAHAQATKRTKQQEHKVPNPLTKDELLRLVELSLQCGYWEAGGGGRKNWGKYCPDEAKAYRYLIDRIGEMDDG